VINAQDRDVDIAPLIESLDTLSGIEKIEALNRIAEILIQREEHVDAGRFAEEALKLAESAVNVWEAVRARINLGTALLFTGGDNIRTIEVLKKAAEDIESLGKDPGDIPRDRILSSRFKAAHYLGRALTSDQDNAAAVAAFQAALESAKEIGNDRAVADTLNRLSICRLFLTEYAEAMAAAIEALEISQRIGDTRLTAANEYIIGYLHRDLGNLDLSHDYFQSSLKNARKAGDDYRSAMALNEIGNVLVLQSKFEEALEIKKEALRIGEDIQDAYVISCCLHDIGNIYRNMKDDRQALIYFYRAFDIDMSSGNAREVAIVSRSIATIFLDGNEDARALSYLERALRFLEKTDYLKERLAIYLNLANVHDRVGQKDRALEYLREAYGLREQILKEESSRELQEIQTKYETEKKIRENEILRQENTVKEIALKQQKTVRHSLILLSTLVFVLASVIYSRYRIKTRANRDLEQANLRIGDQNKELSEAYARLEDFSREDPLTGLANRRGMMEKFQEEKARTERTRRPFSLVMIDVDDFKTINDTYGHDCGDLVLKMIADVLRGSVRKTSVISRWGGDEFLLLLPETDLDGARAAAENIGHRVAQAVMPWKGKDLAVRISLGVSIFRGGLDIDDCLREADQEMYERKRAAKTAALS